MNGPPSSKKLITLHTNTLNVSYGHVLSTILQRIVHVYVMSIFEHLVCVLSEIHYLLSLLMNYEQVSFLRSLQ